jgi:hypothetical protein
LKISVIECESLRSACHEQKWRTDEYILKNSARQPNNHCLISTITFTKCRKSVQDALLLWIYEKWNSIVPKFVDLADFHQEWQLASAFMGWKIQCEWHLSSNSQTEKCSEQFSHGSWHSIVLRLDRISLIPDENDYHFNTRIDSLDKNNGYYVCFFES